MLPVTAIERSPMTLRSTNAVKLVHARLRGHPIPVGERHHLAVRRAVKDAWRNIALYNDLAMHKNEAGWKTSMAPKQLINQLQTVHSTAHVHANHRRHRTSDGSLQAGRRTHARRPSRHTTHVVGMRLRTGL